MDGRSARIPDKIADAPADAYHHDKRSSFFSIFLFVFIERNISCKLRQVDVGYKVSEEGEGNGQGPDNKPLVAPVVQVHHLLKQPLESGGILNSRRRSRREEGGECEGAEDEDGS